MSTTGDAPLNLIKPSAGDAIDLAVINTNYDTINTGVAATETALAVLSAKFPVSVSNLESTLAASVATIPDKAPTASPTFTGTVTAPTLVSTDATVSGVAHVTGYLKIGDRRLWVQAADPSTSAAVGDLWIDLP